MNSPLIPFQTHPSVRIKGTETTFTPTQCIDPTCPNKVTPHLHCPFCVKTDFYQDPAILKAHYRVKHVDKGVEFAGLKILRCCDRCYIVGSIKGEKVFKGPHWHCYKCKNGFNRRDEALKHYKTHFRNPQTTFQIQISQEVNHPTQLLADGQQVITQTLTQDDLISVQPALTEVMTSSVNSVILSEQGNGQPTVDKSEMQVSVAANETVGGTEGQTIMIIQEEPLENVDNGYSQGDLQIAVSQGGGTGTEVPAQLLSSQPTSVEATIQQLQADKEQLQRQNQQLRAKVQSLEQQLEEHCKREEELISQFSVPLDSKIQQILVQMQTSHQELLHAQLMSLKQSYNQQQTASTETISPHSVPSLSELTAAGSAVKVTMSHDGIVAKGEGHHEVIAVENTNDLISVLPVLQSSQSVQIISSDRHDLATGGGEPDETRTIVVCEQSEGDKHTASVVGDLTDKVHTVYCVAEPSHQPGEDELNGHEPAAKRCKTS